jgi:magnesium transporter
VNQENTNTEATLKNEEQLVFVRESILLRDLHQLRDILDSLQPVDIAEIIEELRQDERVVVFRVLHTDIASEVFAELEGQTQESLLYSLGDSRIAVLLNEMSADDRTAFFEELPASVVRQLINLLPKEERQVAATLLGYPESSVGRHMTPDYVMVKPNWNMFEVLDHVRRWGHDSDSLNHIYVVSDQGKLIDDIRIREILLAPTHTKVSELMKESVVKLLATDDQETAVEYFKKYDRSVLPVTDSHGMMLGIITIDDVFDIAEEETTEDIHKLGAIEALDEPFINLSIRELVKKRAHWLMVLFIGEMLTATAMGFFEHEIEKSVALALFIPLIIASGGNAGSQASTLVIRALAIGEIEIKDWFKVFIRELPSGMILGCILGLLGFLRVTGWEFAFDAYGSNWFLLATTVFFSVMGVVLWGSLSGSMLPFVLKKLGADPATSSAPFVATIVDVTGLIIYFSVAHIFLIQ